MQLFLRKVDIMLLEFFKKRATNYPRQYSFIAGPGKCVVLHWKKPQEVEDEIAFRILGEASDIIRKVEAPQSKQSQKKASKVKQSKRKKVVEDFTTA
jgi:hypothetical protein